MVRCLIEIEPGPVQNCRCDEPVTVLQDAERVVHVVIGHIVVPGIYLPGEGF